MTQQNDAIALGYRQVAQLQARVLLAGQEEEKASENRRAKLRQSSAFAMLTDPAVVAALEPEAELEVAGGGGVISSALT